MAPIIRPTTRSSTSQMYPISVFVCAKNEVASCPPRPFAPISTADTRSFADLLCCAGASETKYDPAANAAPVATDDSINDRRLCDVPI